MATVSSSSPMRPHNLRIDSFFTDAPSKRTKIPSRSTAPQVHTPVLQSIDSSPASIAAFQARHDLAAPASRASFVQGRPAEGDIFGIRRPTTAAAQSGWGFDNLDNDGSTASDENSLSSSSSSSGPAAPRGSTWVRQGPAAPLGEMRLDPSTSAGDDSSFSSLLEDDTTEMDAVMAEAKGREWPPSPKKSPVKRRLLFGASGQTRGDKAIGFANIPPPPSLAMVGEEGNTSGSWISAHRISEDESRDVVANALPVVVKARRPSIRSRRQSARQRRESGMVNGSLVTEPVVDDGRRVSKPVVKSRQSSVERQSHVPAMATISCGTAHDKLWEACGRDLQRWNRGDFGGVKELGFEAGMVKW